MGILNRLKDVLTQPSIDDAAFYEEAAREVASGQLRPGIWAKALAECDFDEAKARAIYMKMAVKALQQEATNWAVNRAAQEDARQRLEVERQKKAIEGAFSNYYNGQYAAALEGLRLRIQHHNDAMAMVCLANISWHGLADGRADQRLAEELISAVEATQNPDARRYLGIILEKIDWQRALKNYDWASSKGSSDAGTRARELRKVLRAREQLPDSFFSRIFK